VSEEVATHHRPTREELEELWKSVDSNHDGVLSVEEVIPVTRQMKIIMIERIEKYRVTLQTRHDKVGNDPMAKRAIKKLQLALDENLQDVNGLPDEFSKEEAEEFLKGFDVDHTGKVTKENFISCATDGLIKVMLPDTSA